MIVSGRPLGLVALPIVAALCGVAMLHVVAPSYLLHQGFPLDDAWIHAVYARELARSGVLAYNPGVPATGETAPLWAGVLAMAHGLARDTSAALASTKTLGLVLHTLAAMTMAFALSSGAARTDPMPWIGGALAAFHPDLIAASVSGMEIPLAALVISVMAIGIVRDKPLLVALAGAASALARPETAVFAVFALAYWAATRPRTALKLFAVAAGGAIAAGAVVGARNFAVSGLPLPATFYVKANTSSLFSLPSQAAGFTRLLPIVPLMNPFLLAVAVARSIVAIRRGAVTTTRSAGAALVLSAVAFLRGVVCARPAGGSGVLLSPALHPAGGDGAGRRVARAGPRHPRRRSRSHARDRDRGCGRADGGLPCLAGAAAV
jgi:hypothetical protein